MSTSEPGSIKDRIARIAGEYAGQSGEDTCLSLTGYVDSYLLSIGEELFKHTAVLALGGYGRRELSMGSDIDLLILYRESDAGNIRAWLKGFLHSVWDARVEVKYSAHTLPEVREKVGHDTDFATAVIDYRPLPGDQELIEEFTRWIEEHYRNGDREFVEAKRSENRQRRSKYGDTYKLLDPDIKESAGGLRDLHTIQWLSVGTGQRLPGVTPEDIPSTFDLLQWMLNQETITVREYAALKEAYSFLLKLRHGIHASDQSGLRKNTRMDLNLRHQLAEDLGYYRNGEPDIQGLMQAYYRAAREIDYAHTFFLNELFEAEAETEAEHELEEFPGFIRRNGNLTTTSEPDDSLAPVRVLDLFQYVQHEDLQLTKAARNRIEEMVHSVPEGEFQTPELGERLGNILLSEDAAEILRALLYTEILVKIIPEIGKIRRLHIPSRFHHYTVDEHTFRAIDVLQDAVLSDQPDQPWEFIKIYAEIHDHLPLYWALLLHDIGKAHDGEPHDEIGSREVGQVLSRLGQDRYIEDVQYLIKNHLIMEQFAFRRDTNRPATISNFAEVVETPDRLRSLYLLTYADISAVKPELWTDWKATLLHELYVKTIRFLQDKTVEATTEAIIAETPLDKSDVIEHLEQLDPRYTMQFTAEQISRHLQGVQQIKQGSPLRVHCNKHVVLTNITVITTDQQELLANICGVLSAHNLDIIDASIFTRDDGIVIDLFRVVSVEDAPIPGAIQDKLESSLTAVFLGEDDVRRLVERAEERWRWKSQQAVTPSPLVNWEQEGQYTVLEVTGRDRTGLLYYLSGIIANYGFDIHSAKIHTENQTITDIFYLTYTGSNREQELRQMSEELVEFLK